MQDSRCSVPTVIYHGFYVNDWRRWHSSPGIGIAVSQDVNALLMSYVQDADGVEACGLLVGRTSLDGCALVDYASAPGPLDVRSKFACERLDPCHQSFLTDKHNQSKMNNYMGDWHTHPENYPAPSGIDVTGWIKQDMDIESQFLNEPVHLRYIHLIVGRVSVGVYEVKLPRS